MRRESKILVAFFSLLIAVILALLIVVPAISAAVNCPEGTKFHIMRVFKNSTCKTDY